MIREAFSRTNDQVDSRARTSVSTLVLLLLEGELLQGAQLLDTITGVIDNTGRSVTDQMVNQVQSLQSKRWREKKRTLKICFQYLGWTARVFQIASEITL